MSIVQRLRKQAEGVQALTGNMASQTLEWIAADCIERLERELRSHSSEEEGATVRLAAEIVRHEEAVRGRYGYSPYAEEDQNLLALAREVVRKHG